MRKQFYKVKELYKSVPLDFHRDMLSVKHDAVFIVIYIRGILESPPTLIDGDRYDPVVFSGRMVQAACVSLVLHAEKAFGIAALFCVFSRCNGFWVFFRF